MPTDEETVIDEALDNVQDTPEEDVALSESNQETEDNVSDESESAESLKTDDNVEQSEAAPPSIEELQSQIQALTEERDNLDKRFKGSTKSWQEERELRKRMEDQAKAAQEEAEAIRVGRINKYDPRHPEHESFNKKVPLIEQFLEMQDIIKSLPEEQANAIADRYASKFDTEDLQAYNAWQAQQREMQRKMSTPDGLRSMIREFVHEESASTYNQADAIKQETANYVKLFEDNAQFIDPHRQEFVEAVKSGVDPHRLIAEYRAEAKDNELKKLMLQAKEAKAKSDAAKGKATITRDSDVQGSLGTNDIFDKAVDLFYKKFPKENHQTHRAFYDILEDVQARTK